MKNEGNLIDKFFKLDHPLVDKFKELREAANKAPNTDAAHKFLSDWKKNNPEEAEEMRVFLSNFHDDYKESRREVKSELGYSRVGLDNV